MKTLLTSLCLSILFLLSPEVKSQTLEKPADSGVQTPLSSENFGTFDGVAYVRHRGQFTGVTQSGQFVVPYEITVPINPVEGNGFFLFEPPHVDAGPIAREVYLGPRFVFSNRYSHASVGFGNRSQHILNSKLSYTPVIKGMSVTMVQDPSEEVMDTEILQQFVLALKENRLPFPAQVERVYGIGFSDSGNVLYQLYEPFGHKFFDLSIVCMSSDLEPSPIRGQNPIFIFNTDTDKDALISGSPQLRWYAVAGASHIADFAAMGEDSAEGGESSIAGTTPLTGCHLPGLC